MDASTAKNRASPVSGAVDGVNVKLEKRYPSDPIEESDEQIRKKKQKLGGLGFPSPPGFFNYLPPPIAAVPISAVPLTTAVPISAVPLTTAVPVPERERERELDPEATAVHGSDDASRIYRQFWRAGDYCDEGRGSESSSSCSGGMDRLRVHPKFLHSNATSHKWALGAIAELLDNALDEVSNGATYIHVDMLKNKKDGSKMLVFEDNGGGMTPDKMRQCMSLGYSSKSKMTNVIGHYGNGFKTSTMRLGADVIVFSSCKGGDGRVTRSIGILSYTFLTSTKQEDIIVPMVDYEKRGECWEKIVKSSLADWTRNLKIIVQWSPYSCEEDLLQQFDFLEAKGTRIVVYNLWEDDKGNPELDFDSDPHDIQIRGVNRDENNIRMAKQYPNSSHFLTYRHSLRSYSAILYLRLPTKFRIILRGKDVEHHCIENDMMMGEETTYKPKDLFISENGVPQKVTAPVKIGFVKDARHHIDIQGFNIYHKNRLIKPFCRVWHAAGSGGRGVIGVIEANFVKPAHDKQGFENSVAHARLIERLCVIQKKYWHARSHEIGYVARKPEPNSEQRPVPKEKSSVPEASRMNPCKNSNNRSQPREEVCTKQNKSPHEEVCTKQQQRNHEDHIVEPSNSKVNFCRLQQPVHEDHTAESSNSKAAPNNGHGCTSSSSSSNADVRSKLLEENRSLRKRLMQIGGSASIIMFNELYQLREQRKSLEKKLVEADESVKKINDEQEATIMLITQERLERDESVDSLRNKIRVAGETVEKLVQRRVELSRQVLNCKVERV